MNTTLCKGKTSFFPFFCLLFWQFLHSSLINKVKAFGGLCLGFEGNGSHLITLLVKGLRLAYLTLCVHFLHKVTSQNWRVRIASRDGNPPPSSHSKWSFILCLPLSSSLSSLPPCCLSFFGTSINTTRVLNENVLQNLKIS